MWQELAANFVRDWGDIWNTNSEEHTEQTSVLAFYASDKSPGLLPLVDKIAETPTLLPCLLLATWLFFGQSVASPPFVRGGGGPSTLDIPYLEPQDSIYH